MDLGLSTAASESAHDSPMKLKPQPPLEQEHEHRREHEHKDGSNGNAATGDNGQVSARVASHAADAASTSFSDAGDAELQRRKAALLQQVLVSIFHLASAAGPGDGHIVLRLTLVQPFAVPYRCKVLIYKLCSKVCDEAHRPAASEGLWHKLTS